ncbi:MAG: Smr/MutS family protein [Nitrospirae bacterium]|nr:Smr/MutS family protein [Nitrospirota bacterium]
MYPKKNTSEEFSHQPFRELKKLLQAKKKAAAAAPPVRKAGAVELTAQACEKLIPDEDLFRNAMQDVREIREFRELAVSQRKTVLPCRFKNSSGDEDAVKALEEIVNGRRPVSLSDTQEYVEWVNKDYGEDIIKKLHRGLYSVQDCLDLHGIVVEEGKKEVENFFRESLMKGYRCIKIIHGRGLRSVNGPVMKQSLVTWLLRRYRKNIVAFVTARQCDGGLGAVYVLLK